MCVTFATGVTHRPHTHTHTHTLMRVSEDLCAQCGAENMSSVALMIRVCAWCIRHTQVWFDKDHACDALERLFAGKVSSWVSKVTATAVEVWTERHLALSSRLDLRPRAQFLRSISALRGGVRKVKSAWMSIWSLFMWNRSGLCSIDVWFWVNLAFNRSGRVGGRWSLVCWLWLSVFL